MFYDMFYDMFNDMFSDVLWCFMGCSLSKIGNYHQWQSMIVVWWGFHYLR
jgi:hypothetical protein